MQQSFMPPCGTNLIKPQRVIVQLLDDGKKEAATHHCSDAATKMTESETREPTKLIKVEQHCSQGCCTETQDAWLPLTFVNSPAMFNIKKVDTAVPCFNDEAAKATAQKTASYIGLVTTPRMANTQFVFDHESHRFLRLQTTEVPKQRQGK